MLYNPWLAEKLQRERAERAELALAEITRKYDKLVEDLRRVAMRPQYVEQQPVSGIRKARSSAEIRRMFDQENERILAEKDR